MAWKATGLGTGLVLMAVGAVALVSGLGVTALTPEPAASVDAADADEGASLPVEDAREGAETTFHAQNAVNTVGAVAAATGFILVALGSVVYGVARVARVDGDPP